MSDPAQSDPKIDEMSFEQALMAFEDVVRQLDSGDVPLEKSIALYEHGAKLRAHCETKLKAAEEKVAQITQDANGTATGARPVDLT